MLLKDFFHKQYLPHRLRGRSQNSTRLYELCIKQFSRTLERDARVEDLTEANVLMHLARRQNVAPATRNKELTQLSALWRFANRQGLLDTWPAVPAENEPERTPVAWLPEEMRRLLHACHNQTGAIGEVPADLWWTGLVRLILDTGERVSAAVQCKWSWIQSDWVNVPAEARKGKRRDRMYRLSHSTIGTLREIRETKADGQRVFPWPYTPNYIWHRFGKILEQAGLPSDRVRKFHAIRKTHGSAVYAAGLDPQDALDHTDRRTTQRYLDPRFSRERHASDILADYLRNTDDANDSGRASA